MKKSYIFPLIFCSALVCSCENGDVEFPDFDYQTVYFANQYVDRTIELGDDEYVDLTSDNNHEFNIKATWGGGYANRNNVLIDYTVDQSLLDGLFFKNTDQQLQMLPQEYYILPTDQKIKIAAGEMMGAVKVQLTDAFFNDPHCVDNYYVLPLRMTNVEGADSILSGVALEENPVLTNDAHWSVLPKNFVLYAVKYVNPWHGQYLRRGVDNATFGSQTSTLVRHELYVENDEVVDITTSGYMTDILPITIKDTDGNNITYNLNLTFSSDNQCQLSSDAEGVKVSGSGKFVTKGEENSLGGKDRDAIYLDYNVELTDLNIKIASKDTLVLRARNVYGGATLGVERK